MLGICEIVEKSILPSIRALVAKELINEYGLKQEDVARCLGITQSAISHYIRNVRGTTINIENNVEIYEKIKDISRKIVKNTSKTEILSTLWRHL